MKAFIFLDEEYQDLNLLGLAFASHFKSAMTAIQDPKFLGFIKKFKDQKEGCLKALYENKYVQNVVSILIYRMTTEHILVLGGKRYDRFEDIVASLGDNSFLQLFLMDKGLSQTLIPTLEDEKLKINLRSLENHAEDAFAVSFMKNYYQYDSIETLDTILNDLFVSSEERFGKAIHLFNEEKVQLYLAHHYSLEDIMTLRKSACPVFQALRLLQTEYHVEQLELILEDTFYGFTLDKIKNYKVKKHAKPFVKELLKLKKSYTKKSKKMNFNEKLNHQERLYDAYLKLVDFSEKNLIIAKSEPYAFTKNYANTLISAAYLEGRILCLEDQPSASDEPSSQPTYHLKQLDRAISQHKHFGVWLLVWCILAILYALAAFILIKFVTQSDTKFLAFEALLDRKGGLIPLLVAAGLTIFAGIFILIKNAGARRKYYKLCKLAYYRNNESILVLKEREDFDKLKLKEEKYAKTIDRFYRFYGAFAMGTMSILMSLIGLDIMLFITGDWEFSQGLAFFTSFLVYLPSLAVVGLGCLRHKKTSWSIMLAVVLGIAIGVLFGFLKLKM